MKASAPTAEFCLLGGDLAENGTSAQLTLIKDAFSALGIPFQVWWAITTTCQPRIGRLMSGSFPSKSTTRLLIVAGKSLGWIPVKVTKLTRHEYRPPLSTGSIKTFPNWASVAPPFSSLISPLGESVWARPLNADDLLQRCYGLNLQAVFCGHFHGFTQRPFQKSIITTDKCCARVRPNHDGTPEKGWFVCQAVSGELNVTSSNFGQITRKRLKPPGTYSTAGKSSSVNQQSAVSSKK